MVKLKVSHDLNNMKSIKKNLFKSVAMVAEFNNIQKYYQQKTYLESF